MTMQFAGRYSFKPSVALASVSDWMRRAVASGQPITSAQVETWAAAFDTAERRAREIEEASVVRRFVEEGEQLEAHAKVLLAHTASEAIAKIAAIAREAATRQDLAVINNTVRGLDRALAILADGFDRPAITPENGDRHGA